MANLLGFAGLLVGAILLSSCGGDNSLKALQKVTADPDYRERATGGVAEGTFKGLTDEQAFAKAKELKAHNLFVAFQEIYPDSALVKDADNEIKKFRAFTAKKTQIVPSETLIEEWCWATGAGTMGRWSNVAGGMMMAGGGMRFGDLVFWTSTGRVQMYGGGYQGAEGGIEVQEGTTFIYQAECDGGSEE